MIQFGNQRKLYRTSVVRQDCQAGLSGFWRTDKIIRLWLEFILSQNKLLFLWVQNSCSGFNFLPTTGSNFSPMVSYLSVGKRDILWVFSLEKPFRRFVFSCEWSNGRIETGWCYFPRQDQNITDSLMKFNSQSNGPTLWVAPQWACNGFCMQELGNEDISAVDLTGCWQNVWRNISLYVIVVCYAVLPWWCCTVSFS